jgi:Double zinc ribbon
MTRVCDRCLTTISDDAKFCPSCGTSAPALPNFCSSCGKENAADARFCTSCGTPTGSIGISTAKPAAAPPPPPKIDAEPLVEETAPTPWWQRGGLLIGSTVALLLLLLILFWFNRYEWMGMTPPIEQVGKGAEPDVDLGKQVTLYVIANANLRDKATAKGSKVVGKATRGAKLMGVMQVGDDGTSNWLKIDGTGQFVSAVNLSENEPPKLARFIDKIWRANREILVRSSANANAAVLETVPDGGPIQLVGITDTGFAEVLLKTGGVGYFDASGIDLTADNGAPIALTVNENSCDFGPAMESIFATLNAKIGKDNEAALSGKTFESDEAKDEATLDLEGKSHYQRITRSFNGLSITGIGVHYESKSIYFAQPQDQVVTAFRKAGYDFDADGAFKSSTNDSMASLGRTEGTAKTYSKTELSCGS